MCGVRIGALISKNNNVISAALKFGQARLSPPTLGQIASEAALDTPQEYFDNVISEYVTRRDLMVDGLNKIEGVFCPMPRGAFYCVVRFPVEDADHFCQWLLQSFEYDGATVMMAPCSGFYATEGLGKNEIRIAYILEQESLKKSLVIIEEALKVYPGRTNQ
jgi:aspartate aminotransferase